jgi:hypothetical protein
MQEVLTIEHFRPLKDKPFCLELDGVGRVELILSEVTDLGPRPGVGNPGRDRTFSLIFRGGLLGPEKNLYLAQRTYKLEQEDLGSLEIFLVPIGPDKAGMRYEAIFN